MACVDLPAFPLQILLKRHPEWRGLPAAVIDEDRPQGVLLWVNERARAGRILSGMRYAAALSLSRELRAGVVPPEEIAAEIEALMKRLRFFSPEVEHAREDPGTFWLNADGLGLLHPSFPRWAELIRDDLAKAGYGGRAAVGFSRFGSYAAARAAANMGGSGGGGSGSNSSGDNGSGNNTIIFHTPEEERAAVRRIPIERISCDPDFRDTLARLGIFTLGGFLDLPPAGVRRRFGEEAFALHRRARGELWSPLAPEIPEEPHERRVVLDAPESDRARLLEAVEGELQALIARLRARDRALAALVVEIGFDRAGADGVKHRTERLCPTRPTRDLKLLLDLLRLRLESLEFPAGATEMRLEVEWVAASAEQTSLFPEQSGRDLEAANRALARVRAEFGEPSVCAARLREAHLPEARFALEPLPRLGAARPRKIRLRPLVRRILDRPESITLRPSAGPDDDSPLGRKIPGAGAVREALGPYVVSGGWWRRQVERRYWYVRLEPEPPSAPGAWIWIYHDALRRRWFRQGDVE
jgi:protein ImuB